jgi:drug/metabolite transporter (DMT)-like permease
MIALYFLMGALLYVVSVCLIYNESFKKTPYFIWVGLFVGLVANYVWLSIAKQSKGADLYVRGLIWDCLMIAAYTLIPVMFYGIKLTPTTIIGCVLIIVGIFLTKVNA